MLQQTNTMNVITRKACKPMHLLENNQDCQASSLPNTGFLFDRMVNVPNSERMK
jgi:hypothetical protein